MAQSLGDVALADTDRTEEDDRLAGGDEAQGGEVADGGSKDARKHP